MKVEEEAELVAQMCSVQKVFFEISQNSQENFCGRVSFLRNFIKKGSGTGLSRNEQVSLIRLRFERYFSHHRAT